MGADQDLGRAVEQRWNRAKWSVFLLMLALAAGVLIPSLDAVRVAIALAGVGLALLVLALRPADIREFVQRIQKVSVGKTAVELGAAARGAASSTLRDPAEEPEPTEEQRDPIDLRLLMEAKLSYLAKFALSVEPRPTFVTVGNLHYDKLLTDLEARTAVGLLTLREGDLDDLPTGQARKLIDDANTFVDGMRITVFYRFVKQVLENSFSVTELEHKPRPDFLVGPDGTLVRVVPVLDIKKQIGIVTDRLRERSEGAPEVKRSIAVIPNLVSVSGGRKPGDLPLDSDADPAVIELKDLIGLIGEVLAEDAGA